MNSVFICRHSHLIKPDKDACLSLPFPSCDHSTLIVTKDPKDFCVQRHWQLHNEDMLIVKWQGFQGCIYYEKVNE